VTQAQAKALLHFLIAAYPDTALEPTSADVYLLELESLNDGDAGYDAVRRLVRCSQRFPSIAEIRSEYRVSARNRDQGFALAEVASGEREMPESVQEWVAQKWGGPREMPV